MIQIDLITLAVLTMAYLDLDQRPFDGTGLF